MGKFCKKCGNRLNNGDLFCPVCGNKNDETVMESAISNNISSQVVNISENIGKYAQEGRGKFLEFTEKNNIGISGNAIKEHIAINNLGGLDIAAAVIYALSCLSVIGIGLVAGLIPGLIVAFLFYICRNTIIEAFSKRGCWKPFFVHYIFGAFLMMCFMVVASEAHRFAGSGIGLWAYIFVVIVYLIGHKIICAVYPSSKPQGAAVRLWVTIGLAVVGRFWGKNNKTDVASDANVGVDNQAAMTTAATTTIPLDGMTDASSTVGIGADVQASVLDKNPPMDSNIGFNSVNGVDSSNVAINNDFGTTANGINGDNSTQFGSVADNMGGNNVTITDNTGGTQATVTQVSDNRFEIKDSMGIPHGDVYVNNGTGEATINIDGETLNVLSNGEVRDLFDPSAGSSNIQPDGSVIVQDNMSQYAGGVLSDGTIVDSQMNPVGKVHKH